MKKVVGLVITSLLLGCTAEVHGPNVPGLGGSDEGGGGTVVESYTVDGMPAGKYFEQFLYRPEGTCNNNYSGHYLSSDSIKIGQNSKGQDILASINVFLNKENSQNLEVHYSEVDVASYTENGYIYKTRRERIIKGSWNVEKDEIVLNRLGRGTGIRKNDIKSILFTFGADIVSKGLSGKVVFLSPVISSDRKESYRENCPEVETTLAHFAKFEAQKNDPTSLELNGLVAVAPESSDPNSSYVVFVFIFKNGNAHLVVQSNDPSEERLDLSSSWTRNGNDLKFGYGDFIVRYSGYSEPVLIFNKPIELRSGRKVDFTKNQVQLRFQKSVLVKDDLN